MSIEALTTSFFVMGGVVVIVGVVVLICLLILGLKFYALDVELSAMKKSTHKIQWMPVDQNWSQQSDQEINNAFESDQGHPDDFKGLDDDSV